VVGLPYRGPRQPTGAADLTEGAMR
jgi:hypothetical protein